MIIIISSLRGFNQILEEYTSCNKPMLGVTMNDFYFLKVDHEMLMTSTYNYKENNLHTVRFLTILN